MRKLIDRKIQGMGALDTKQHPPSKEEEEQTVISIIDDKELEDLFDDELDTLSPKATSLVSEVDDNMYEPIAIFSTESQNSASRFENLKHVVQNTTAALPTNHLVKTAMVAELFPFDHFSPLPLDEDSTMQESGSVHNVSDGELMEY